MPKQSKSVAWIQCNHTIRLFSLMFLGGAENKATILYAKQNIPNIK